MPYWAADWGPAPGHHLPDVHDAVLGAAGRAGPDGPVQLAGPVVAYGGMDTAYDDDYAC